MLHDALLLMVGWLASVVILLTVASAAHTLVVPRGTELLLIRWVMAVTRALFDLRRRRPPSCWSGCCWSRACYERVLLQFASRTTAPPAPWSADRPIAFHHLPVTGRRARPVP
jgi:hypothetical protein